MVAVEAAATPSRRFALLMAARDSDYVLKKYGGYLHVFVAAPARRGTCTGPSTGSSRRRGTSGPTTAS